MITAGTYPSISIDLGKDEPGMTLQYRQMERGYIVWRDYTVGGEVVKSPIDVDKLPHLVGIVWYNSPTHQEQLRTAPTCTWQGGNNDAPLPGNQGVISC